MGGGPAKTRPRFDLSPLKPQVLSGDKLNLDGDPTTIARAAFPFFMLMVLMVVLLYAFPQIITFLPEQMRN